jgi:hypothetical protein
LPIVPSATLSPSWGIVTLTTDQVLRGTREGPQVGSAQFRSSARDRPGELPRRPDESISAWHRR